MGTGGGLTGLVISWRQWAISLRGRDWRTTSSAAAFTGGRNEAMPIELRASSLPLLLKCPGALSLPSETAPASEENLRATEWGTMVHRWKETGEINAPSKRAGRDFERALAESGLGASRLDLWPAGGTHECTVAVRVDGIRDWSVGKGAECLLGEPHWCTGHADFWWRIFDGELWVDDLKTGRFYPNPAFGDRHDPNLPVGANRFPQNPDSYQTQLYALAVAEKLGYAGPVHTSITHWPRLPVALRHSPPDRLWHLTHTNHLRVVYWGQLETLYQEARTNARELTYLRPGSHCRFCPARSNCMSSQENF